MFRFFFCCCLLLASCASAASANAARPVSLGLDLPYWLHENPDGTLSLPEFLALPESAMSLQHTPLARGYSDATFWMRVHLPAELFAGEERWLQFSPSVIDHLRVHYRPVGSEAWQVREAGDHWKGERGDLRYRFPLLRLPAPPPEGYEMVLRVQSTSTVLMDVGLWEPGALLERATRQTAIWSFYFGMMLLTGMYALLQALVLKKTLFWPVFALMMTLMLLSACVQGFVAWFMPATDRINLQSYLTSITNLQSYGMLVWMGIETLKLRQHMPRMYRLLLAIVVLVQLNMLSIPLGYFGQAASLQFLMLGFTAPLIAAFSVHLWRQGHHRWPVLLVGMGPMFCLIFSVPLLLITTGVIPYSAETYAISNYALMSNMVLVLLFAMWNGHEENRIMLEQQQVVRELNIEREAGFHQRQFIGMVSHEFRTPLSVISATLQNLHLSPADAMQQKRFGRIQRATERLIQLTDNCLADARLSAHALHLEQGDTDLRELVRNAIVPVDISGHHELQMRWQGQTVTIETLPSLPLRADAALLGIALSNLLDNAVKHTEQGCIRVDISADAQHYHIQIQDQGDGVPVHEVEHIFERYRRAEGTAAQHRSGTGLGLYVARQILLAHGGQLQLLRNTRQGCCFELLLPLNPIHPSTP